MKDAFDLMRAAGRTEVGAWKLDQDNMTMTCDITKDGVTKQIRITLQDQVMLSTQEIFDLITRKIFEAFGEVNE